jgi:mRNA m6A methyltransferase non-catalytic subunit
LLLLDEEKTPFWSTEKPTELFDIIERFCLGRKKIQLFGSKDTVRKGWLTTMHKDYASIFTEEFESNYEREKYEGYFNPNVDYSELKDHEGGRYVGTTTDIEALRPKTPAAQQ